MTTMVVFSHIGFPPKSLFSCVLMCFLRVMVYFVLSTHGYYLTNL